MQGINTELTTGFCGLGRRIAVIFYDCLLLLSIFFISTLFILPFTDDHVIQSGNILYFTYLLLLSYIYFSWQWTHGGQTLGMRAWHVRLIHKNEGDVSTYHATLRFILGLLS